MTKFKPTIHILQIGLHDQLGGIETFAHNYFTKLDSKRFQIDYISTDSQLCFEQDFRNRGSEIFYLPSFKLHPLSYARQLRKILRNNTYDIIHIHMLSAANILPLVIAKRTHTKCIVHSHNNGTPKNPIRKLLHMINKRYLRHADHFWACSQEAGNWLFPANTNFEIIPNAIDLKKFQPNQKTRQTIRNQLSIKDDEILVGHVGRFAEQKNHSYLIKVFKNLNAKHSNTKLLLIGDGKTKHKIIRQITRLYLSKQVITLNPQLNIEDYYQAMDVFVLPSKFEGLPIVGIEAQASQTPCIFSNKISPEIILTHQALRLSIGAKYINKWVDAISSAKHQPSKTNKELLKYDLKLATTKLKSQYLKITSLKEDYV